MRYLLLLLGSLFFLSAPAFAGQPAILVLTGISLAGAAPGGGGSPELDPAIMTTVVAAITGSFAMFRAYKARKS